MRLAAAIRDARTVLATGRRQARIVQDAARRRSGGTAAAPRHRNVVLGASIRLLGPALVPLSVHLHGTDGGRHWSWFAAFLVLLFSGHHFAAQALDFTPTDVLRQPSKAGVLFARLWRRIPIQAAIGACWALAGWLLLGGTAGLHPSGSTLALAAIAVAPAAWLAGRLAARLAGGEVSVGGPALLLPAIAGVLLWQLGRAGWSATNLALAVPIAALGLLGPAGLAVQWARRPRLHATVLLAELAALPRLAFAVVLLLPEPQAVVAWLAQRPGVGGALLLFAVASCAASLRLIARDVPRAEERTRGAAIERVDAGAPPRRRRAVAAVASIASAPPPSVHRGRRSLLHAQWLLHRARFTTLRDARSPSDLLRSLPGIAITVLYHAWGPLLGVLAVIGNGGTGNGGSLEHRLLALAAGLTAPTFIGAPPSAHLHRLGVDYLDQVRLRLCALGWFAVLPTLAAALVAAGPGLDDAGTRTALAVLAAAFALRAGWRGLFGIGESGSPGRWQTIAMVALGGALAIPVAGPWPPIAIGALGVLGLLLRVRRWNETALAIEMLEPDLSRSPGLRPSRPTPASAS